MRYLLFCLLLTSLALAKDYSVTEQELVDLRRMMEDRAEKLLFITDDYDDREKIPDSQDRLYFREDMETEVRNLRMKLRQWVDAVKKSR